MLNTGTQPQAPPVARFQILAAALLFSTGGAAIKLSTLPGAQIACFRSGVAALLLWILIPSWRRGWSWSSLIVGTAFGATLVLFVLANTFTTAANAIFLQYSAPLYLLILGPLVLKEANRRSDVALLVVLATGMVLIFAGQDLPSETAPHPNRGNVLGACAGVTWALTLLGFRWIGRNPKTVHTGGAAVIAGNAIAFLVCSPWALPVQEANPVDWAVIFYLGAFQIAAAYMLLTRGVRSLRALEVSLLLMIEPVGSALWAWLVHHEAPTLIAALGCTLIFVSVLSQSLLQSRKQTMVS